MVISRWFRRAHWRLEGFFGGRFWSVGAKCGDAFRVQYSGVLSNVMVTGSVMMILLRNTNKARDANNVF